MLGGRSASRRRRDWDDGIAGYFKAKHPRLRLTVSEDETSETCRTFESHAKHAGFRRARIQQQKTNQGCRRRRLAAAGWPRYEHRERRIVILHLRQRLMRRHSLFFSRLRVPQGCARTKGTCSTGGPARDRYRSRNRRDDAVCTALELEAGLRHREPGPGAATPRCGEKKRDAVTLGTILMLELLAGRGRQPRLVAAGPPPGNGGAFWTSQQKTS